MISQEPMCMCYWIFIIIITIKILSIQIIYLNENKFMLVGNNYSFNA